MNVRNPKHTPFGSIEMEIEHPTYGWIPFSASANDTEQYGRDLFDQAAAGNFGLVEPYIKPFELSKSECTAAINTACAAAIVGGFESSALGAPHRYDSAETDQINLIGAAALGIPVPYTCTDAAGVKMPRDHTATQLKTVMADGAAFKLAQLARCATLKAQIAAATTVAEVEAVVW